MDSTDLKDIIIALINKGEFDLGINNEEIAKDIAKFEKAYYAEAKN